MLSMLVGSQGSLLVKTSFSAWSECVYQMRQLREVEQMKRSMRSKGQEGTKRMLGMLLGSQAELMEKAAFGAWHELISVLKKDREVERMKAGLKAKGEESTKRMLAMLMGSQEEVLKKAAFAGWHEILVELRQQDHVAEMQRNLREKGAESSKRMLRMLVGSQTESLLKAVFSGWLDFTMAARIERIRQDNLKMRSKGDEEEEEY